MNPLDLAKARFWSKVDVGEVSECWPWRASAYESGHGSFRFEGRNRGAHRLALEWCVGPPLQSDLHALHSCDNPPCVNPHHLRWGTHKNNMDDMIQRGRKASMSREKGNHPKVKVTQAQAEEMRSLYESGVTRTALALEYGVTWSTAYKITRGDRRVTQ